MRRNASIDVAIHSRMIFVHVELEIIPFQVANVSKINRGKIVRARGVTHPSCYIAIFSRFSLDLRSASHVAQDREQYALQLQGAECKVTRAARIASRPFLLHGLHLPLCTQ